MTADVGACRPVTARLHESVGLRKMSRMSNHDGASRDHEGKRPRSVAPILETRDGIACRIPSDRPRKGEHA